MADFILVLTGVAMKLLELDGGGIQKIESPPPKFPFVVFSELVIQCIVRFYAQVFGWQRNAEIMKPQPRHVAVGPDVIPNEERDGGH